MNPNGQQKGESVDAWLKRLETLHNAPEAVNRREQTQVVNDEAVNSALFGIPQLIAKTVDSDNYKKYQEVKERQKLADISGNVVGSFMPTGGLLLKGAGAGAKAVGLTNAANKLARAGQIVDLGGKVGKYGKVVSGGIRGGLTGLEQVVPRVLAGQTNLKDAGLNVGLSAGFGGAASALGKGAEYLGRRLGLKNKGESFVKPLQESLIDKELTSLTGLTSRDMLKASNATARLYGVDKVGNAVNNAEQMKKSVLGLVKKNDILNPDEAQEFIQGAGKRFQNLEEAFEKSGAKPVDVVYGMAENPEVLNYLDKNGESGKELLGGMFNRIKDAKSIASAKKILNNYVSAANKTDDIAKDELGDIAHIIRENLDDMVLQFDPNYTEIKADWKALQPLRYMVARDKTALTRAAGGSPTAEKQALMKLIGGASGGSAAYNMSGFDKDDPSTWGTAAATVAGGAAAGSMLNRAIPAVKNMVSGGIAGALNRPGVLNTLEKAGKMAPEIADKGVQWGERFLSGRLSEPKEQVIETPEPVQDKYSAPNKEDLLTAAPEATEPAKPAVNEKLMGKIDKKLMQIYAENYADQVSWEDFHNKIGEITNGFEPVKASKILYEDPKQRAKFIRDYKASQKLKGYSEAYAQEPGLLASIENFGKPGKSKEQRAFDQKEIADTIGNLLAKEGELPTDTERKQIALDLKTISALKATPEQKQAILFQKLRDFYGFDLDALQEMGLV